MRIIPLALSTLVSGVISLTAADVPNGLTAMQYDNKGSDLLNKHQYAEARKYFDAAIRVDPKLWTAHYNRAMTYQMEENWQPCLKELDATLQLKPDFVEGRFIRSIVYRRVGDWAGSLKDLNILVKTAFDMNKPRAAVMYLNDRAWVRATAPDASVRDGKAAVADAKKACELSNWKRSDTLDSLAAGYAESGDFAAAVKFEQQAMDLAKSGADDEQKAKSKELRQDLKKHTPQRLQSFAQRIEMYKQHHPYRDTP